MIKFKFKYIYEYEKNISKILVVKHTEKHNFKQYNLYMANIV